ncbi:glycosyltransferase [Streptomyces albidoflavus]|uniref:glycosyltransferase n=1 Tax=Streptomyces albidoflavus TaxID=1886 RepID=UPI00374D283A
MDTRFPRGRDAFTMPRRTRRAGLEAEGPGIDCREAAASGLPVAVGDSGGAPDTVLDGRTGIVVDGRDVDAVAAAVVRMPTTAQGASTGRQGRHRTERSETWDTSGAHLKRLLTQGVEPAGAS